MSGYQQMRYYSQDHLNKEPIYGQFNKRSHPLFEDLKNKQNVDKAKYEHLLKFRKMQSHQRQDFRPTSIPPNHSFNSLTLLGTQNDSGYLDNFMTPGSTPGSTGSRSRHLSAADPNESKNQARSITKSASTGFFGNVGKGQRNSSSNGTSAHLDTAVQLAMLSNLRSVASADSIYQSVEMIHYLKAKKTFDRERKTKALAKSGHPLFDHLREENAMKAPPKKPKSKDESLYPTLQRRSNNPSRRSSTGNSPSQSSGSSGDEYDNYPRLTMKKLGPNFRQGRPLMSPSGTLEMDKENRNITKKQKEVPIKSSGSESDDELRFIPRPRLVKGQKPSQLQPSQSKRASLIPSEESDSSARSSLGGLR